MITIGSITCTCPSCMEEHEISLVETMETNVFKGEKIEYRARYHYCERTDETFESEEQMAANDMAMKDAYREKQGLLTSREIMTIRSKYDISQADLALLLGWGEKTITRYEGHQVQDMAHDSILRKIDRDPEWYLDLLNTYREKHPFGLYQKYYDVATDLFAVERDSYLRKSILGRYAKFGIENNCNGNTILKTEKVVDAVRFFSNSPKVKNLYKAKLMKLLWYADALAFKRRTRAITGLVYEARPTGAVPMAHDLMFELKGISYEEEEVEEGTRYHYIADGMAEYGALESEELDVLEKVAAKLGGMERKKLGERMANESAYKEADPYGIVYFNAEKTLSIK